MTLTIGVDVGGTKIAAGLVTEEGEVLRTARRDTPASEVDATADAIADLVTELRADEDDAAVGIGAAVFCDAERTSVVYALEPRLAQ